MKNKIKFRLEGLSFAALVLLLVVFVNIIFGVLGERYDLKLDLTGGGVYTLAPETKEVLSSLDKEITLYYATNADSRNVRYQEIMEEFKNESPFIKVEEINIDTDPGFARRYQIRNYNSVVVESEETGKKRVIDNSIIENSSANDNGMESSRVNYLEGYISAALRYVTSDDPLSVYITMGHGEVTENTAFLDHLMNMLYSEAMTVKVLDLTTDNIPGDTDMLLFAGPTIDFTDDEIKKVDDYLEKGGRMQFYSNPAFSLPNINGYFQKNWGVKIENNCVSDNNSSYIAKSSGGNFLIPVLAEHAMTQYLLSVNTRLRTADGETNSVTIEERNDIEATPLVTTSISGVTMSREDWNKKLEREEHKTSEEGNYNITVYLRKNPLNNNETTARLLVSGSHYMLFDRMVDASSSYGDKDLIVKSINYMSGIEDAPVSVAAKNVVKEKMEVLKQSALVFCIALLVAVIPLILFAFGIYVYIRRSRL